MVDFTVKNQDLINFITKASAKGIITVSATEKIAATFFKRFFIEAIEDRLEIKALDTQGGTMWAWHVLSGVDVEIEGKFGVTDSEILLELLKSITGGRKINFYYEEDKPLTITTADEGTFKGFELREWATITPKELEEYNSTIVAFMNAHTFDEDNVPIIGEDPEVGTYSTIVKLKKADIGGVIQQSIKLTLDQDIRAAMDEEGNMHFMSGKENASIKAKDSLWNVAENPIVFDQKFGNLQPVIPHLYDDITIYMRKASDGKMKWWMRSKKDQIELNFVTAAI